MSDEYNNLDENSIELSIEVPPEVNKWNWAACLLPFIWALFNVKPQKALMILVLNLLTIAPIFIAGFSGFASKPENATFIMLFVGLFLLNPLLNFIISIVFCLKGNVWAWQDKVWESVEQFLAVQKKWTVGVLIYWVLSLIVILIVGIVFPAIIGATMMNYLSQKGISLNSNQATELPVAETGAINNNMPVDTMGQNLPSPEQINEEHNLSQQMPVNPSEPTIPAASPSTAPSAPVQNNDVPKTINSNDILDNNKKVTITVGGHGRENPFKPFYDKAFSGDFPPPDDIFKTDETAANLMAIKVAGILFDPKDPYNASAIVKIANTDYMVKKGDTISGYKILVISKESVAIKYGSNTYSAGIGQTVNPAIKNNFANSGIDNMNKKFAGNRR